MNETRTKCPKCSELKLGQEVWRESVCFLLLVVMCSEGGHHWVESGATVLLQLMNQVEAALLLSM